MGCIFASHISLPVVTVVPWNGNAEGFPTFPYPDPNTVILRFRHRTAEVFIDTFLGNTLGTRTP